MLDLQKTLKYLNEESGLHFYVETLIFTKLFFKWFSILKSSFIGTHLPSFGHQF